MKRVLVSFLLITLLLALVSCGFSKYSIDSIKTQLQEVEYTISIDKTELPSLVEVKTGFAPTACLIARNGENSVYVFEFKNEDSAKAASDFITEWGSKQIQNIVIKIDKQIIIVGSEQTVLLITHGE